MKGLAFTVLLGVALSASPLPGQDIRVRDAGPRGVGRPLIEVIASPHYLRVTSDTLVELPRDSSYDRSILIIGARRVTVASRVAGSVIVIGGDLFLHPGVQLTGDAVAYGGGVYSTSLGSWRRIVHYRDFTYDLGGGAGAYTLTYRPISVLRIPLVDWPGLSGFRIPFYDRTNGLSLGWGPRFNFDEGKYTIDVRGIYRSDLGEVDPRLEATVGVGRLSQLSVVAERATPTNEVWIRDTLLNSISSIGTGTDVHNYWRADRGRVAYRRTVELTGGVFTPAIGALTERAWSVGPEPGTSSNVWAFTNRTDTLDGLRRPNPPIMRGRISSGVIDANLAQQIRDLSITGDLLIEAPFETPDDSRWVQGTVSGRIDFPTFPDQSFRFEVHALVTGGDVPPPQRFSYLGGSGTIPTLELLSVGGDQLLFVDSRYTFEFPRLMPREGGIFSLLALGSVPSISLRHMIGSAGIDHLPGFVNNVGVRLAYSFLKADFMIDPESRDTDVSIGLSFNR